MVRTTPGWPCSPQVRLDLQTSLPSSCSFLSVGIISQEPHTRQLHSLQSDQRRKNYTHQSWRNLPRPFPKLSSSFDIYHFVRFFFFFKSHKSCLSFRPHKIWCHHALSTLPNSIALRCFPFSHHLPEAFLLPCRRQVAIIPSGDENSHCSPLSYSNNIICLIKRWQRKREWEPTSWVVKDSLPLALSYFLFSTHYFGFIKFIATW